MEEKMKVISVRVNKTIEYEVHVPVSEENSFDQTKEYLDTLDWEEAVCSDGNLGFKFKHIAEYFDWIDYD